MMTTTLIRRSLLIVGVLLALALWFSRHNAAHSAPTGTPPSGPSGLTALASPTMVVPGTITSAGQALRVGESSANAFDPVASGLSRPVGSQLTSRNGTLAWWKYGTGNTAWGPNSSFATLLSLGTDTLLGRDTAGTGAPESITVGGGLSFTGSGGIQIAADGVDNTKLANMANATIKCRTTAGTGDPEDCTGAQAGAIIGATGGGAMVLVSSQDVTASPITWSSLTGDNASTSGYRIVFRLRSGGAGTTVALRINNLSTATYTYLRTQNAAGTVTGDTTAGATEIALHGSTLASADTLTGTIDIPISGQSGANFGVGHTAQWTATLGTLTPARLVDGSGYQSGTGTEITRLDLLTTAGSLAGGGGSRAALYRIAR